MFSEIFYILLFWSRRSRIKPSIGQKANGNNSKYHILFKKFHSLKFIAQYWQCSPGSMVSSSLPCSIWLGLVSHIMVTHAVAVDQEGVFTLSQPI